MIHADHLWKKFGRHEVIRDLSFVVPEGSAFALIGANGAGKTTTIKLLMNIFEPSRGIATVLGVNSRKLSPRELCRIGYVSVDQELPERLTVAEYLDYLRPFYPQWDSELAASLLRQLRLPCERRIRDLSYGTRTKMKLACALPFRPQLLILDEPFSGLDPLVRDEFMESLLEQAGEMTILLSSHELAEIDSFATHVGFMDEGELLFEESITDLTARFREVCVVLEREAPTLERTPTGWLHLQTTGNIVTFVDTRCSEDCLGDQIRSVVSGVSRIYAQAMPLRSIFTTLARASKSRVA